MSLVHCQIIIIIIIPVQCLTINSPLLSSACPSFTARLSLSFYRHPSSLPHYHHHHHHHRHVPRSLPDHSLITNIILPNQHPITISTGMSLVQYQIIVIANIILVHRLMINLKPSSSACPSLTTVHRYPYHRRHASSLHDQLISIIISMYLVHYQMVFIAIIILLDCLVNNSTPPLSACQSFSSESSSSPPLS